MKPSRFLPIFAVLFAASLLAQEPGTRVPSVTFAPVGKVQIKAGGSSTVQLDFRVGEDFHINSNQPKSELLIPTALIIPTPQIFKPGTPVGIASVQYPPGEDVSFPFAPGEKLSVYSGDFSIKTMVRASPKATAGDYPVTVELRFQACDRSACYPPRAIPVKFVVTVAGK